MSASTKPHATQKLHLHPHDATLRAARAAWAAQPALREDATLAATSVGQST